MFKFFWTTHKWVGIILALVFTCTSVTGFMLLIKKKVDWIQPPTQKDAEGPVEDSISPREMFAIVLALDHPDFQSFDDIDRVDFRPGERVFKVQSKHRFSEVQVGAITGEVLSVAQRPSDLLEDLHDGSFYAGWVHEWLMPIAAAGLLFMVLSGLWLWVEPKIRKARRKRRRKAAQLTV
ncbi:MAG: PepSY domain-containing protein [Phycisphaerales bacterium]|nr:MAG: PepSY domain-containing protein [Phycisphaerales bacterium]